MRIHTVDCPAFTAITTVVDFDPYRSDADFGGRLSMYGRMGGFGGGYGRYYAGLEGYGDRPSFGYPNRFGL